MTELDTESMPDLIELDVKWNPGGSQFEFVVDNQAVADLLDGMAVLANGEHIARSSVAEALEAFLFIIECGWVPKMRWCDPVMWRPRHLNRLADAHCNVAINLCRDDACIDYDGCVHLMRNGGCIQFHCDGGARAVGISAVAFTITGWTEKSGGVWERELLGWSRTFVAVETTAFPLELSAVLQAIRLLKELVNAIKP